MNDVAVRRRAGKDRRRGWSSRGRRRAAAATVIATLAVLGLSVGGGGPRERADPAIEVIRSPAAGPRATPGRPPAGQGELPLQRRV